MSGELSVETPYLKLNAFKRDAKYGGSIYYTIESKTSSTVDHVTLEETDLQQLWSLGKKLATL